MLALIAAYAERRVIGFQGKIPWHIPGEQSRFRMLTTGQTVIMGRRTYAEIGRPLPDRITIVLSHDPSFSPPGCQTASSLSAALDLVTTSDVFLAGGGAVYAEGLSLAQKLFLTEIHADFPGDTFFPVFEERDFLRKVIATVPAPIPYTYLTYTRRT